MERECASVRIQVRTDAHMVMGSVNGSPGWMFSLPPRPWAGGGGGATVGRTRHSMEDDLYKSVSGYDSKFHIFFP